MRRTELGGSNVVLAGGVDGSGEGDGPVVVLMHGFGAPGEDLVPLARALHAPAGTRFVFPEAPIDLGASDGGGPNARAWWWIDTIKLQIEIARGGVRDRSGEVPEGLGAARDRVRALLDAVDSTLRPSSVALGGFSQGAMLALDVALHDERPLAGLVLMSGTLIAEREWSPRMSSRKGLPVFMSHGDEDPLLAFAMAERLRDVLSSAGLAVRFMPFRGGHGIPEFVLASAGKFLREVLVSHT